MCLVSIHELIQKSRNKKSDNCDAFLSVFEVERLLCEVIEVDRAWLRTHPEYILSSKQKSQYSEFKARRERGEPISYIIGRQGFWTLELKVNENVLIPRPESELIIEIALELPLKENSLVLDLGTGSGALALALASEKSKWNIIGTDIYDTSLQMAEANRNEIALENVIFIKSNWFDDLPKDSKLTRKYDLVVSNPPYLDKRDPHLQEGDLRFEPKNALVSLDFGLADIKKIIYSSIDFLAVNGWLVVEHGFDQGYAVRSFFQAAKFVDCRTVRDLNNLERVTLGRFKG